MELLPNSLSFRVVNTLDVDGDLAVDDRAHDDVPADFTGRVRHHDGEQLTAVAWYAEGRLHDPARRVPALVRLRPDGQVKQERHYRRGDLHDPEPGRPAVRGYFADGSLRYAEHYRHGRRVDGPHGQPAIRKWRRDGTVRSEVHYPRP